jgi:hypothetical protein
MGADNFSMKPAVPSVDLSALRDAGRTVSRRGADSADMEKFAGLASRTWLHLCDRLLVTRDPQDRAARQFTAIVQATLRSFASPSRHFGSDRSAAPVFRLAIYLSLLNLFRHGGVDALHSGFARMIERLPEHELRHRNEQGD